MAGVPVGVALVATGGAPNESPAAADGAPNESPAAADGVPNENADAAAAVPNAGAGAADGLPVPTRDVGCVAAVFAAAGVESHAPNPNGVAVGSPKTPKLGTLLDGASAGSVCQSHVATRVLRRRHTSRTIVNGAKLRAAHRACLTTRRAAETATASSPSPRSRALSPVNVCFKGRGVVGVGLPRVRGQPCLGVLACVSTGRRRSACEKACTRHNAWHTHGA